MSYQSKQLQKFNGDEQIQIKQGQGRFNLFTKLSDLANYFRDELGIGNSTTETLSISIQDAVFASTGVLPATPTTDNGVLGISIDISAIDNSGTGTPLASCPQQIFNSTTLNFKNIFTEFDIVLSEIPSGTIHLLVYVVVVGSTASNTYIAKANYGKGNQLINFFIGLAFDQA